MNTITVNDVTYDIERSYDSSTGDTILTIEQFPGLEGTLGYDDSGAEFNNPREWANVGTMAVSYPNYNLGDEDISQIDFEVQCPECDGSGEIDVEQPQPADQPGVTDCPKCEGTGYIVMNPVEYFKKVHGARVVLPLIVYEH